MLGRGGARDCVPGASRAAPHDRGRNERDGGVMTDLRELLAELADDEPVAAPAPLFDRIQGRARHLRRRRRSARVAGALAVLIVGAGIVGVVARQPSGGGHVRVAVSPPGPPEYQATGTVLQNPAHGPELCQMVADSLPPQCSGIPIAGWDWAKVDNEESRNGTTWGSYHVVGTYDGDTLTLTQPPGSPGTTTHKPEPKFTTPCEAPPGGWTVRDRTHFSIDSYNALHALAQSQPDYAGAWVDNVTLVDGKRPFFPEQVITFTFTGNLDAHRAQLEAAWGGPLCIAQQSHSERELSGIQTALQGADGRALGLQVQGSGIDSFNNRIDAAVIVATPALQRAVDEKYGSGAVQLNAFLRPVGG